MSNNTPVKITKADIKRMDAKTRMYLYNQIGGLSNFDLNVWARAYENHPEIKRVILQEYEIRKIA